jgi:hypothetical protein
MSLLGECLKGGSSEVCERGILENQSPLALMNVVVTPSARETFTPRELTDAYKDYEKRGPQYLDTETGLSVSAYRFDERVLLVYEEAETGVVVLMRPSASKVDSPKS